MRASPVSPCWILWCGRETMHNGCNRLAKPDKADILSKLSQPVTFDPAYRPFGDGHSAEKIVEIIKEFLS